MAWSSPGATSRETSWRAVTPGKRLVTRRMEMMGAAIGENHYDTKGTMEEDIEQEVTEGTEGTEGEEMEQKETKVTKGEVAYEKIEQKEAKVAKERRAEIRGIAFLWIRGI